MATTTNTPIVTDVESLLTNGLPLHMRERKGTDKNGGPLPPLPAVEQGHCGEIRRQFLAAAAVAAIAGGAHDPADAWSKAEDAYRHGKQLGYLP